MSVLYFANPCSDQAVTAAMRDGLIGFIDTPAQGNSLVPGARVMFDNGCYGKGYPGDEAWLEWLSARACTVGERAEFATAPDVVGDAEATLARSLPHLTRIRRRGLKAALVAQNGIERTGIPWSEFDVLFLGGSLECVPCGEVWPNDTRPARDQACPVCGRRMTEWKEGAQAAHLTQAAHARGKWVHMGRVNSWRRFPARLRDRSGQRGRDVSDVRSAEELAEAAGVASGVGGSVDGTGVVGGRR